jgi:DNA-binding NarL/FixJ family response regulator
MTRPRPSPDTHRDAPATEQQIVDALVPVAARLVATVRDYGPDDIAAILNPLDKARLYRLAIVLAAMVDPDANAAQLLHWTTAGPVQSRDYTPPALRTAPADAVGVIAERRAEIARLTAEGAGPTAIAARLGLAKRTVVRYQTALRAASKAA